TVAGLKESVWGPVPHEVKVERLERLQAVQRRIGTEIAGELVGQEVEVLVEGPSRSHPERRFGRTPDNRTVNFDGSAPAGARARAPQCPFGDRGGAGGPPARSAPAPGRGRLMAIRFFQGVAPRLHPSVFVADGAQVIGDVEIGEESSVWYNTVLRGDVNSIRI